MAPGEKFSRKTSAAVMREAYPEKRGHFHGGELAN